MTAQTCWVVSDRSSYAYCACHWKRSSTLCSRRLFQRKRTQLSSRKYISSLRTRTGRNWSCPSERPFKWSRTRYSKNKKSLSAAKRLSNERRLRTTSPNYAKSGPSSKPPCQSLTFNKIKSRTTLHSHLSRVLWLKPLRRDNGSFSTKLTWHPPRHSK